VQSSSQIITTNIQFFIGRMPFLSPNQQCQSTEWKKISHSVDLLTPNSTGGLPTLSLTTSSCWLPVECALCKANSPEKYTHACVQKRYVGACVQKHFGDSVIAGRTGPVQCRVAVHAITCIHVCTERQYQSRWVWPMKTIPALLNIFI